MPIHLHLDLPTTPTPENMYSYDNMRTNLRHILELLIIEDEIVNEACSIINIPNLIHLVKTCISNSGDSAKCSEIFLIIEDIENITKGKKTLVGFFFQNLFLTQHVYKRAGNRAIGTQKHDQDGT